MLYKIFLILLLFFFQDFQLKNGKHTTEGITMYINKNEKTFIK